MEHTKIVIKYIYTILLPKVFLITEMAAIFVAGPAIKNTKAAPGSKLPDIINPAAIGTEAVAQIYIGIDRKAITINANKPVIPLFWKKLFGIAIDIIPANKIPFTRGQAIS